MKKLVKFCFGVIAILVLQGCAYVRTSSTTFHGPNHEQRGKIIVMPVDKNQEGSLEFKSVSDFLTGKLASKGYEPVVNPADARFLAFITYGIDNGSTSVSAVPLYGQTGGGTSYSSGTVSSYGRTASFSGTTTTMPSYGVIGSMPVSSTEYKRKVNIDIWRRDEPPVKVYEIRGQSSGSCGNINSILFNIIDGIFEKFPGENGKSNRVDVDWNGKC